MEKIDGYINRIRIGGKTYKLQCEVVEVHPLVCKKCGASFQLKHGEGQCPFCNTYYTTIYNVVEGE